MRISRVAVAVGCVWVVSQALAAAEGRSVPGRKDSLEEVIVTARLRKESARDVPFALSVLGTDDLVTRRIDDTHSLFRQVPGLSLTSFDDGRFAYFQLRGIGPLSQAISPDDGSVVTYIDGVPQPVYASELAYLDLERIEVLRGPQGTLFGRNSQGGALNITTRAPGYNSEATVRLEGGNDDYGFAEAAISGPFVADRLAARLAARGSTVDGFVRNVAPGGGRLGDRDSFAARGTLFATPTGEDGALLALTANVDRQKSNPFYYVLLHRPEIAVELAPENRVERTAWGASLKAEVPLSFAELTSITACNGFDNDQVTDDTDGFIYGPLFEQPASSFLAPLSFSDWSESERRLYQEVRLSDRTASGLAWTSGAVYFHSAFDVALDNRSTFSPYLNGNRDARQEIDSYAAFGELTVPWDRSRLFGTLGLRYSRDEKTLSAQFQGVGFPGTVPSFSERGRADFDLWTGRAALLWKASDAIAAYATVARGAKSGGFPRFTLNAALGSPSVSYAASTSWTYEIGMKAAMPAGRGHVDVSAFHNDVTDEQLFVLDFVTFQFLPVNLDTHAYGIEAQLAFELGHGWNFAAAAAWTQGEIREASAASGARPGHRIPNVARFGSSTTLRYVGEPANAGFLRFTPALAVTHQYMGKRAVDVAESFDLPAYHNVDLRLGARFDDTEIYLFARNAFDSEQQINGVLYGPGVEAASLGRDRIAGIGFAASFQ
jgi:iron complex outermembrane recepter protein